MRRMMLGAMLVLVMILSGAHTVLADGHMQVHFVVITSSDDVTEADFQGLKEVFLQHAGGYTEMPSTVGSSMNEGKATPEQVNTSFLVAGERNIASEIRKYVEGNKHFSKPFILVWEAKRE